MRHTHGSAKQLLSPRGLKKTFLFFNVPFVKNLKASSTSANSSRLRFCALLLVDMFNHFIFGVPRKTVVDGHRTWEQWCYGDNSKASHGNIPISREFGQFRRVLGWQWQTTDSFAMAQATILSTAVWQNKLVISSSRNVVFFFAADPRRIFWALPPSYTTCLQEPLG